MTIQEFIAKIKEHKAVQQTKQSEVLKEFIQKAKAQAETRAQETKNVKE